MTQRSQLTRSFLKGKFEQSHGQRMQASMLSAFRGRFQCVWVFVCVRVECNERAAQGGNLFSPLMTPKLR